MHRKEPVQNIVKVIYGNNANEKSRILNKKIAVNYKREHSKNIFIFLLGNKIVTFNYEGKGDN